MKFSTLAAYLAAIGIASANPLLARQETTSSSSVSSSSDSSTTSSSLSTSTTSTSTATSSATQSSSSSSSSSTSSSSTSTSSGSMPTATNGTTGAEPCSQDDANHFYTTGNYSETRSLCGLSGNNNTIVIPAGGLTKFITWWPGAFPTEAKVRLSLNWMDGSGRTIWNEDNIDAIRGFVTIPITQDFLYGGASSSYYRLLLNESDPNGQASTVGPVISFFRENTSPPPPSPTSFNFLGVAIGVPIAVAVIVAVLGVFCCVTNRHRSFFARIKLPTNRRGYGVRQSRRQRMGNPTEDYDFDASAPIYRDDPGADYSSSTREERSARAMGVFSAERNLHSTY